jgi:hypothetical protein
MIGLVRDDSGCLNVFVRGTDNAIWIDRQVAPGGAWAGFNSLGGGTHNDVAVAANKDGRLEIFIVNDPGNCWHTFQTTPGGAWAPWGELGSNLAGSPSVIANADGRLEVFARGTDNAIWHNWQVAPGGAWAGFNSLPSAPAVVKWTYLLKEVTIDGTVSAGPAPLTGDGFYLIVDTLFAQLTNLVPNRDDELPQPDSNTIKCETYPDGIAFLPSPGKGSINHYEPWPLPQKDGALPFTAKAPGLTRNLSGGDHVRISGRLVIENGHPEHHSPWIELHPFDYNNIQILEDAPLSQNLICVAPLYSGATYAGISGGLIDATTLVRTVQAELTLSGPPGSTFNETVIENSTGLPIDHVRIITFDSSSGQLNVKAAVTALGNPGDDLLQQRAAFLAVYTITGT